MVDRRLTKQQRAEAISARTGMTVEQVLAVFDQDDALIEGDPVSAVRPDEAARLIYVRTNLGGAYAWHVVNPDTGEAYNDQSAAPTGEIVYQLPEVPAP